MPEIRFTCLYCDHKWSYVSFYISKEMNAQCSRCKETKMLKMHVVTEKDKTGNIFGYEEEVKEDKTDDDDYRD